MILSLLEKHLPRQIRRGRLSISRRPLNRSEFLCARAPKCSAPSRRDLLVVRALDRTLHELFILRAVDQHLHAVLDVLQSDLRIILDTVSLRCEVKLGIKSDLLGELTCKILISEVIRLVQSPAVDQKYEREDKEETGYKTEDDC